MKIIFTILSVQITLPLLTKACGVNKAFEGLFLPSCETFFQQ